MSAEAIVKPEHFIVLAGTERPTDLERIVSLLDGQDSVAISFRHVGGVDMGFLGDPMIALAVAGVKSVRAVEATPHELKFMKLVAFNADLVFAA
jgi:hypothetical protein